MDNAKRPTDDDNDDNTHTNFPNDTHDTDSHDTDSIEYGTEISCPGGVVAVDIVSLKTNTTDNCIKLAFYADEDQAINPAHALVPRKKQITAILGQLHEWLLNNLED